MWVMGDCGRHSCSSCGMSFAAYMGGAFSVTAQELYETLMEQKRSGIRPYCGYAETTQPLVLERYKGFWEFGKPAMWRIHLPSGSTVKIVMVSSLGDMGITNRLHDDYGYGLRVLPESGVLTNCRLTRD